MVGTTPRNELEVRREMTCVCCNCQREQTASNEWRDHTPQPGERLTHGICPACLYVLYPDIAPYVRARA
jgi:hypothetical protein